MNSESGRICICLFNVLYSIDKSLLKTSFGFLS